MSISLANPARGRSAVPPRARARVVAYARRVLAREGVTRPDVTIVLGDDALLRSLHAKYKGKDRATDVLSFTLEDERAAPGRGGRVARVLAGEIYVSRDRLLVQAKRYRHSPGRELLRLVTHGLLHLAGHDHMKPGERRVMRAAERTAERLDLRVGDRAALEAVARAVAP
jgi:probable rRNA maturation factor